MKLRIECGNDGEFPMGSNAKVYDVESGEVIPGVYRAEWSCDATGIAKVVLYMNAVEIDAEGVYEVTSLGDDSVKKEYNGPSGA